MELKNLLVLDTNRNIDVDASVEKFRGFVIQAAEAHKNDLGIIADGVSAVYNQYPGSFIQIDALKSIVLQKLNVHPSAYGAMADRLHKFVQENTDTGNGNNASGEPAIFRLKKGKGGGFCRLADLKPISTTNA
jgi:hypothetical protein